VSACASEAFDENKENLQLGRCSLKNLTEICLVFHSTGRTASDPAIFRPPALYFFIFIFSKKFHFFLLSAPNQVNFTKFLLKTSQKLPCIHREDYKIF
jgi:uncharacterized membrane protein